MAIEKPVSDHHESTTEGAIDPKEELACLSDPRRDPEWVKAEKKLVRKLDATLLPMVWVLYMFNYLDRNNIA